MNIGNVLKIYIGPLYTWLASLCSIASLVLLFVHNKTACIIALCVFCVGLLIIIYGVLRAINGLILNNSDQEEYKRISSFFVYQSRDGKKSTFEVFRLIQCKRMFLTQIPYKFKWTGKRPPNFKSEAQEIVDMHFNHDENSWDNATIRFKSPLKYNECTVVHVKSENDDHELVSKTWISTRLEAPIEMILFRVLLPYKENDFNSPAIFERKRINSDVDTTFKYITSVDFNVGNKLYTHCELNPEPGYIYRLRWEGLSPNQNKD